MDGRGDLDCLVGRNNHTGAVAAMDGGGNLTGVGFSTSVRLGEGPVGDDKLT